MSRTRVKICGITSVNDALQAVEAGADALGFVFHPKSPRFVTPEAAAAIITRLPPFVMAVGLFVDASREIIDHTAAVAGLQCLQLHGEETPDFCAQFRLPVIKAFRVRGADILERLPLYNALAGWLLDAYVEGISGGTGARFDWTIAAQAARMGRPVVLAGGLNADNVARAVEAARPYAVDVSSGVEESPGRKDPAKVSAFVSAATG